jgi:hypothetical protein
MDDFESLSHSKWECKYHVVFSYRNVAGKCCTGSYVHIWARCSTNACDTRKVGSKRGI